MQSLSPARANSATPAMVFCKVHTGPHASGLIEFLGGLGLRVSGSKVKGVGFQCFGGGDSVRDSGFRVAG